jgi:hypothetical protein
VKPSLTIVAAALFGSVASCWNDPAYDRVLDELPEETGEPSALHRPGQPCVACHASYEGAEPALAVGGTIYTSVDGGGVAPLAGVLVVVSDSAGAQRKACSNGAGNFHILADNWADVAFPLTVHAGDRTMRSLIGRDGSCASCHKLPGPTSLDPITGAGRDSPGVILVDPSAVDPTCTGGAP